MRHNPIHEQDTEYRGCARPAPSQRALPHLAVTQTEVMMEIPMTLIQCANCGMPFALSTDKVERLRECHNDFYCPAGHIQSFVGKSEADKLRDALEEKERTKLAKRRALAHKKIKK